MIKKEHSFKYQAYYCEENIWQLCQEVIFQEISHYALFISNRDKSCALSYQKAALSQELPVFWDYHLVMIAQDTQKRSWNIWDLDTRLRLPLELRLYLDKTFSFSRQLNPRYAPLFRLVESQTYINQFSSDRSHMLKDGQYTQPPPTWKMPYNGQDRTNLMQFLNFDDTSIGKILTINELISYFYG